MKNAAIDIGFGHTKFCLPLTRSNEELLCDAFPSVAAPATPSVDLSIGGITSRDTISVRVDQATFEVGKGVMSALPPQFSRILDASYPTTAQYMALLKGALHYIAQPEIDMLVLGLPVNAYTEYKEPVTHLAIGVHSIPNPRLRLNKEAPRTLDVTVRNVRVVPQPVGALINFSLNRGLFAKVRDANNLVFDVGYGTADWFMSTGLVAQAPRCGSHAGGMSTFLQAIADQLRPGLRDDTLFLERLDNAIRDWVKGGEGIFRFRGKEFFVKDYADLIKSKLSETISAMSRSIGSKDLVDYVTLTGGGAFLYEKAIKDMFDGYEIFVDSDARFSNVKGFYALGEQALQQLRG